jgi:TonB family protein
MSNNASAAHTCSTCSPPPASDARLFSSFTTSPNGFRWRIRRLIVSSMLLLPQAANAQVTLTSVLDVHVAAGSGAVQVTWNAKSNWAANVDVDWLTFPMPRGGTGTWGRTLGWLANRTGQIRVGHLMIAEATLTVTQAGEKAEAAPSGSTRAEERAEPTPSAGTATANTEITPPSLAYKVEAEYTPSAKRKNLQGYVRLAVTVDADGRPIGITVTKGLGEGLDENAVEAVSKWRFRPAVKDGKPVPCPATIDIVFRLP